VAYARAGTAADSPASAGHWGVVDVASTALGRSRPDLNTGRTAIAAVTVDVAEPADGAAGIAVKRDHPRGGILYCRIGR
jgi:hypothetical protein